jgi:hypothetical protein
LPPEQIEAHFRQGFDVDVFEDDDIYDPNRKLCRARSDLAAPIDDAAD